MFRIKSTGIDVESLRTSLGNPAAGALCTFEGLVRNENEGYDVLKLEYEAYEPLAVTEGEQVIAEARDKFGVLAAVCEHRTGLLEIGECAVWVGVIAPHRDEAFRACRYVIDEIKHRLPIWKKEYYANGDSGWVNCERCAEHGKHDHD